MAGILEIYERLEIDARKFAQEHKDADDRMKNILETAFLFGEQHVVTKIMNHFTSKEKQKTMETKQLKLYTGTKQVMAEPMDELAAVEKGFARKNVDNHEWRQGYHVRHTNPDGSTYDSWAPKQVFEQAYRPSETFLDRLRIEYE